MTSNKKYKQIAKIMFKNSLTDGHIDTKKVNRIIKATPLKSTAGFTKILSIYKKYMEQQNAKEELIIESANTLPSKNLEKELLLKTGAKKIKYQINPKMVAGAKIKHGDWVYDASLTGKLDNITIQI